MIKKSILIIWSVLSSITAIAQADAQTVYDKYLDFNLARLQNEPAKALELGESILPDTAKLPPGARVSFYFSIAKLYEDDGQSVKALPYYEKVVAAVPNYYVAHRALGYMYIKDVGDPSDAGYGSKVKKALPHLEKAQACDPSDETLELIKKLYQNINDLRGLGSLGRRLVQLSKNCVDILNDR